MMEKLLLLTFFLFCFNAYTDRCADDDLVLLCGGNGRTYKNECYLEQAGVELAYAGKCVNCEYCTGAIELVCGNDGRTYTNSCWADCNGTFVVAKG